METMSWAGRSAASIGTGGYWSSPRDSGARRNAIVGGSEAARRVLQEIEQVAATNATVLLLGETGTGKELYARHLHQRSVRRHREMVCVNCGAIPATLIESELFGRERGAYTDAVSRQIGRFELADQSTIFLDEIGDLAPEVQVKLLRVLEDHQIERLGNPKGIRVNVRIVAATHRNLAQRVADGTFREDLFYRLNVFPIEVPPLRERAGDIPLLVWHFIDLFGTEYGKTIETVSDQTMAALQNYGWPGNVRELSNLVERAVIMAAGPDLAIPLPVNVKRPSAGSDTLVDVEKAHIKSVLDSAGWKIRGARGAANRLGLPPTTLESRMAKLGLARPKAS